MARRSLRLRGLTAGTAFPVPAVAPAGEALIYYDALAAAVMLSIDGGAAAVVESSGAGGDTLTIGADLTLTRVNSSTLAFAALATGDSQLTINAAATHEARLDLNPANGSAVLRFLNNGTAQYQLYQNGSDPKLYLRDVTNTRMHVTFTPGTAGNALTEFHDKVQFESTIEMVDTNVVLGTATGTQFGTAANQKSAFHGAAPVVQVAGAVQTYATATGTHANPTAAALTVTDGAGTNDGTIGAITADASVIAAVQELADQINKAIADIANVKQFSNFQMDGLQLKGFFA